MNVRVVDVRKTQTAIVGFKDEIWVCGQPPADGKVKKMDLPETNTASLIP